ncbi:MAG: NfeD family protein [Acidimicrobiia bacterium]
MTEISQIVQSSERYWREAGVSAESIEDMKAELESHLRDAESEGKSLEAVVGPDLESFAAAWAAEQGATTEEAPEVTPRARWAGLTGLALGAVAVIILALVFGERAPEEEVQAWRWIWLIAAVVLGIAEMLAPAFFILPFAIGAVAAAILAWFSISVPLQLLVFIVVSILTLIGLQRFMQKEEREVPVVVGATRYSGRLATVLEDVDRRAGTGEVRMDTEVWRATTKGDGVIHAGTEVTVVEVVGTRLVVERREN